MRLQEALQRELEAAAGREAALRERAESAEALLATVQTTLFEEQDLVDRVRAEATAALAAAKAAAAAAGGGAAEAAEQQVGGGGLAGRAGGCCWWCW